MLHESEAIILRTYPFHEADLLVTLFTRDLGKLRGVARAAKKSKKRFGGALEPLTHVVAHFEEKDRRELVRLDSCDVVESPLSREVDLPRAAALGYVSEMLDQLLPEREPHDDVFRLTVAVLHQLKPGAIWMPLTYFSLWMSRLMGLLPELHSCIECGDPLTERAFFHPFSDGLMCTEHKRLASNEMSIESREVAAQMFRAPINRFAGEPWPRSRASELRKFLLQRVERHIERELVTPAMLERVT